MRRGRIDISYTQRAIPPEVRGRVNIVSAAVLTMARRDDPEAWADFMEVMHMVKEDMDEDLRRSAIKAGRAEPSRGKQ